MRIVNLSFITEIVLVSFLANSFALPIAQAEPPASNFESITNAVEFYPDPCVVDVGGGRKGIATDREVSVDAQHHAYVVDGGRVVVDADKIHDIRYTFNCGEKALWIKEALANEKKELEEKIAQQTKTDSDCAHENDVLGGKLAANMEQTKQITEETKNSCPHKNQNCIADFKSCMMAMVPGQATEGRAKACMGIGNVGLGCIETFIDGFFKDLWNTIIALPQLAYGVVKAGVGAAVNGVKAAFNWVEDHTSNSSHALMRTPPAAVADANKDRRGFLKKMMDSIWDGAVFAIHNDYGCEKWNGVPHLSGCAQPMGNMWDCATCDQQVNVACGIVGLAVDQVAMTAFVGAAEVGGAIRIAKIITGGLAKLHGAPEALVDSLRASGSVGKARFASVVDGTAGRAVRTFDATVGRAGKAIASGVSRAVGATLKQLRARLGLVDDAMKSRKGQAIMNFDEKDAQLSLFNQDATHVAMVPTKASKVGTVKRFLNWQYRMTAAGGQFGYGITDTGVNAAKRTLGTVGSATFGQDNIVFMGTLDTAKAALHPAWSCIGGVCKAMTGNLEGAASTFKAIPGDLGQDLVNIPKNAWNRAGNTLNGFKEAAVGVPADLGDTFRATRNGLFDELESSKDVVVEVRPESGISRQSVEEHLKEQGQKFHEEPLSEVDRQQRLDNQMDTMADIMRKHNEKLTTEQAANLLGKLKKLNTTLMDRFTYARDFDALTANTAADHLQAIRKPMTEAEYQANVKQIFGGDEDAREIVVDGKAASCPTGFKIIVP